MAVLFAGTKKISYRCTLDRHSHSKGPERDKRNEVPTQVPTIAVSYYDKKKINE